MSSRSTNLTTLAIVGATILGGAIAYAAYFDYKRRNDAQFRRKLRSQKKKVQQTIAEDKKQEKSTKGSANVPPEIIQALHARASQIPIPESSEERHASFMSMLSQGEALMNMGPESFLDAAFFFYQALRMYPSPVELINIYEQTVTPHIIDVVMNLFSLDVTNRLKGYYDKFPPKSMNVTITPNKDSQGTGQSRSYKLVATKDIKAGETIYKESPAVASLDADLQSSGSYCSQCLRQIEKGMAISPASDLLGSVYCSKKCQVQAGTQHHNFLFGQEPILPPELMGPANQQSSKRPEVQTAFIETYRKSGNTGLLLTARFIALQFMAELAKQIPQLSGLKSDLNEWSLDPEYTLLDHVERLRYIEVAVQAGEHEILQTLVQSAMPFAGEMHTMEKHTILRGKVAYNAIGVCYAGGRDDKPVTSEKPEHVEQSRTPYGTSRQIGSGVYLVSSYISHSCDPSTRPSFSSGTSELTLIAVRDIKEGEELSMAYVDVTQHDGENAAEARKRRRQAIAKGWRFTCTCQRCSESDEGDTNEEEEGLPETDLSKVEASVARVSARE